MFDFETSTADAGQQNSPTGLLKSGFVVHQFMPNRNAQLSTTPWKVSAEAPHKPRLLFAKTPTPRNQSQLQYNYDQQ